MFYRIQGFPEDYSSPGPVTIYFDTSGNPLDDPEIRRVPQITGIDGVDTTFFGFDVDNNGLPNFFGTSAAAPDVAAVAALVLQSAGGPGSLPPDKVYERLEDTATPVALSEGRTVARASAGPLKVQANGDFPRVTNYWQLAVESSTPRTINQVSINLTVPEMHFSNPASTTTGFRIGIIRGLSLSDVTVSRSADLSTLTLTFAPGTFGAGASLTFANFAFPIVFPYQTEVDADRVEGGQVTVTWEDGSTHSDTLRVERTVRLNAFTGAGLVNAEAATRFRSCAKDGCK